MSLRLPVSLITAALAASSLAAPETISWDATQAILDRASSIWTAPPRGVVSELMTRGPLLGNGGLGVTAESNAQSLSLLISHNGFICDARRPSPARIGGLTIEPTAQAIPPAPTTNFRLEQNLATAELRAVMNTGWTLRSFVAATEDAMVTEVSNQTAAPLELRVSTWTPPASKTFPAACGRKGSTVWATRETFAGIVQPENLKKMPPLSIPARWVSRAALVTRIPGIDSPAVIDEKANRVHLTMRLKAGEKRSIITRLGMRRGVSLLDATLAATSRDTPGGLNRLEQAHRAWWRAYWNKSQVLLNDAALERYYYSALYTLASASRAGQDAPGLYGNWITRDAAQWSSDIHLNYNGEAPYFAVYSANRPELAAPFNAAMIAMMPEGRRRAKNDAEFLHPSLKGKSYNGILYPVGVCSSLGVAACDLYLNQAYNASYAAMQFIEQFEYTQDPEFLKSAAYPFVLACGDFWQSYLEPVTLNGQKQYPFSSGTREGMWAKIPSTDLAYIQRIFRFLLDSSRALGRDDARRARWKDILDHLPPFPTLADKDKTPLIAWDAEGRFGTGENCFGIDCIYPGNAFNLESAPEALKLARDTASRYAAWGHFNNMPRIFLARLRVAADPSLVREKFFQVVKGSMGPNAILVDSYHGMEKCGGVEVINRLLLNSDGQVLRIFPDWDRKQDASFRNLRARGAFLVSASLKDGSVSGLRIISEKGRTCTLVNPWPGQKVSLGRGSSQSGDRLTFPTRPGETLEIKPLP